MKDSSRELRKLGRGYNGRVHRANKQAAAQQEVNGSHFTAKNGRRHTNWIVRRLSAREVVAIEPNRDYEEVFEGGSDPFEEALEYAAAQIRKGTDE
jgi:hypothetical protein